MSVPQYMPVRPIADPGPNGTDGEKQSYAWKYHGYPELSAWMASSNDSFVLRRFSATSARTLLFLQNQIAQKEKAIADFDAWTMNLGPDQGGCGSFQEDQKLKNQRNQILKDLVPLLQQYYDLVNAFTQVKSRPTARDHHIRNLSNWDVTYKHAIDQNERHLFDPSKVGDLFPLISKPVGPLRGLLEKFRVLRFRFKLKPRADRDDSENAKYTSDTGFENFTSIVIVVVGLSFLFGPMWWLNWVDNDVYRLAIITGSISVFATWLWIAIGPRGFEILGATAAYAAVLMVYLQVQRTIR